MIEDANLTNLAETLARTGLCASPNEAMKMARSISSTEKKVSTDFKRVSEINKPSTKSYQEEIDELIRKTSPEHKQYHIPIAGYNRERPKKDDFTVPTEPVTEQVESVQPAAPAVEDLKKEEITPVYTDSFTDERSLRELIGESVSENITIEPVQEKEEFIINVEPTEKPVEAPAEKEEPEQMCKEIVEDKSKPREIKNPIDKVDLMNFFKFGQ